MNYTDDGYATMLLTMALSPDREEYAKPLGVQEFRQLEALTRKSELRRIGALLNLDISGLMIYLGLPESEAYRAYTLLHRSVQLTYALEGFLRRGIDVVTCCDAEYPDRVRRRLGDAAPAFYYRCGNAGLLEMPVVAIMGISGVRTTDEVRSAIEALVSGAAERGYAVATCGELGVSKIAAHFAAQYECPMIDVLGGGMAALLDDEPTAIRIAGEQYAVLSTEHPEAMQTGVHAAMRNRLLLALSEAAFVFNTDARQRVAEAIQNRYCDWIYAWQGGEGCGELVRRGAIPLGGLSGIDLAEMSRRWKDSGAEQLNMFDLLG